MPEEQIDVKPVSEPSTDAGSEPVQTQPEPVVSEAPQPQKPPRGYVPYQALEEERRLRKEAEEKLENIAPEPSEEEEYSDEGKALRGQIKSLNEKLRVIERKDARREVEAEFPVLKDKKEDFEEFLQDEENSKLSIRKAAQVFLAEKGLLHPEPPERVVLEKPTGGGVTPPEHSYTKEEIEDLRKNNWRKYEQLLRAGKI